MSVVAFDVGIKNLAYCQSRGNDQEYKLERLGLICLESDKKQFDVLAKSLFGNLSSHFDLTEIDTVLIENQPVKINPTMKSIQMMIYSFFFLKNCKVKIVSAGNKTSLLNRLPQSEVETITAKLTLSSKYANTKRLAVLLADSFLSKHDTDQHQSYLKMKKRDDVADAFLMTINYCNAFQII